MICEGAQPTIAGNAITQQACFGVLIDGPGSGGRLERNGFSLLGPSGGAGVMLQDGVSEATLLDNTFALSAPTEAFTSGYGVFVDRLSRLALEAGQKNRAATTGLPLTSEVRGVGGEGWEVAVREEARFATERPAIAAWWDAQEKVLAAEARGVAPAAADAALAAAAAPPDGFVATPAAFDVTVAPGEDVQAAVDACPPGGTVLLGPGTHAGPLTLGADKEVHVFGRGRATLRAEWGDALLSRAARATVDGLIVRREAAGLGHAVCVSGGRLRLQACDIANAVAHDAGGAHLYAGVCLVMRADPVILSCR